MLWLLKLFTTSLTTPENSSFVRYGLSMKARQQSTGMFLNYSLVCYDALFTGADLYLYSHFNNSAVHMLTCFWLLTGCITLSCLISCNKLSHSTRSH